MANPRGQQRDKPYREALRLELAAAGDDLKALRRIARAHIEAAASGDMAAIREMADRLDGKPAQTIDSNVNVSLMDDLTPEQKRERAATLAKQLGLDAIGPVAGSA